MLEAMKILGYGTMYNSREMWRRNHSAFLSLATDAKYLNKGQRFSREQFESIWGEYRAISGEPAIMFKEELLELYPDAKVILTIRDDEDVWFQSVLDTLWYNYANRFQIVLDYIHPIFRTVGTFRWRFWKHTFLDDFPAHGKRVYREHNEFIRRTVPEERLLVFNVKQGWEPLCEFLDVPIPDATFPHVFRTNDHRTLFANARKRAYADLLTDSLRKIIPLALMSALIWKRSNVVHHLRLVAQE